MSCNLNIQRESRMGYAARNIRIYLDGTVISNLGNGKSTSSTINPGKHNIGFAVGKTIVTEVDFQIEGGTAGIICWVDADGGVSVRLTDYNIPHTITEKNTLGKAANRAVSGTVAAVATLITLGVVSILIFLLRFM